MSRGRWTLLAVSAVTAAGVASIHHSQQLERQNLHQGVLRDELLYKAKLEEQAARWKQQ